MRVDTPQRSSYATSAWTANTVGLPPLSTSRSSSALQSSHPSAISLLHEGPPSSTFWTSGSATFEQPSAFPSHPLRRTLSIRDMNNPFQPSSSRGGAPWQTSQQFEPSGLPPFHQMEPFQMPSRRSPGPTLPSLRDALAAPDATGLPPLSLGPSSRPSSSRMSTFDGSSNVPMTPSTSTPSMSYGFSREEMQQTEGMIFESGPPYACEHW